MGPTYLTTAAMTIMLVWPLLWLASVSTYKVMFGPAVAVSWPTRRRVKWSILSFAVGLGSILYRYGLLVGYLGHGQGHERAVDWVFLPDRFSTELGANTGPFLGALLYFLGHGLFWVLAIALIIKLYEKWVNGRLTHAERAPGTVGLRAWLSVANLATCVALAACAFAATNGKHAELLVGTFAVATALVLAYPTYRFLTTPSSPASPAPRDAARGADLSPERERVLRLLEQGRITADESAELLTALAATLTPTAASQAEPWTPQRKLLAAGAATVLVAFFLPWYAFNLAAEVQRFTDQLHGQMQGQLNSFMGGNPEQFGMKNVGTPAVNVPQGFPGHVTFTPANGGPARPVAGAADIKVPGGDVQYGLGWVALLLGLTAAGLPYVATGLSRPTQQTVTHVAVVGGIVLIAYLITRSLSAVSYGLPLALVGFALQAAGLLREARPRTAAPTPAAPAMA
jgi:hypothetical protein